MRRSLSGWTNANRARRSLAHYRFRVNAPVRAGQTFPPTALTGVIGIAWPKTVSESSRRRAIGASAASDQVCGQAITTAPAATPLEP
jgi:hypothetical protein